MLSGMILQLVLAAIEDGPQIFDEAQKLFSEIGGKDDGIAKLQKAATSFLQLANHAATASVKAATVVQGVDPAPMPAPPADSPSGAASEPATPAPAAAAAEIMNSADRAARQAEAESVS